MRAATLEADFVTGLTDTEIHVVDFTGDLDAQIRALAPGGVDAILHLAGDSAQLADPRPAGG